MKVKNQTPKVKVTKVRKTRKTRKPRTPRVLQTEFNPAIVKLVRGQDLDFSDASLAPMVTGKEIDVLLSTEGGVMPGTNIMLVGGPGSGKTTIALDILSNLTQNGYKCLFVSAEMDEIQHFKYCKRMPHIGCVSTLFLKNYAENPKPVLEYVFNQGYDVICIDSFAEVIELLRDAYRLSEAAAETWLLHMQDSMKKGGNALNYFTTFINIQQVTKGGDFVGSNRIKHMTDAMGHVERSKDGMERYVYFSKHRDCDKDFKLLFAIGSKGVHYSYELVKD